MKKLFSKLFGGSAFGLVFGNKNIYLLKIKKVGGQYTIKSFNSINVPSGFIENGAIKKEKEVGELIKQLIANAKPEGLKTKNCIVAIPNSQVFENTFFFPNDLSKKDFEAQLQKVIFDNFPLSEEEMKFDYSIKTNEKFKTVYVSAIKREVIAQYYAVTKHFNKLNPTVFEPISLSFMRNINDNQIKNQSACLIKSNEEQINISFIYNGLPIDHIEYSRKEIENNSEQIKKEIEMSIDKFTEKTSTKIQNAWVFDLAAKKIDCTNILPEKLLIKNIGKVDIILPLNVKNANQLEIFELTGLALFEHQKSETLINFLKKK